MGGRAGHGARACGVTARVGLAVHRWRPPQWGGRYHPGLRSPARRGGRRRARPRRALRGVGLIGLAVAVTAFGLAWTSVRTHDVAGVPRAYAPARARARVPRGPSGARGARFLHPRSPVAHRRHARRHACSVRALGSGGCRHGRRGVDRGCAARRRDCRVAGDGEGAHAAVLRRRSAHHDLRGGSVSASRQSCTWSGSARCWIYRRATTKPPSRRIVVKRSRSSRSRSCTRAMTTSTSAALRVDGGGASPPG